MPCLEHLSCSPLFPCMSILTHQCEDTSVWIKYIWTWFTFTHIANFPFPSDTHNGEARQTWATQDRGHGLRVWRWDFPDATIIVYVERVFRNVSLKVGFTDFYKSHDARKVAGYFLPPTTYFVKVEIMWERLLYFSYCDSYFSFMVMVVVRA